MSLINFAPMINDNAMHVAIIHVHLCTSRYIVMKTYKIRSILTVLDVYDEQGGMTCHYLRGNNYVDNGYSDKC